MSRLDDLPADQRAALSLLLAKNKSYSDVAAMLGIQQRAVEDRAHAALAVLAPRQARELTAEGREQVGDYLLGQSSSVGARMAARTYLDGSPQARAWARAIATELQPLAAASLPEIPEHAAAAPAPDDRPRRSEPATAPQAQTTGAAGTSLSDSSLPSSRVGGGLLLAGLIAVVIVVVVLITGSGGSSSKSTAAATGTSTSTNAAKSGGAKEDKRITLTSPDPSSKAVGVAEVLSEGNKHAFYLAAEHIPPSKGKDFFYAIWLYNSPSSNEAVSKSPPVGSDGRMQGGALLPDDAAKYHKMLVTRETSERPSKPGPVVLSGDFALH